MAKRAVGGRARSGRVTRRRGRSVVALTLFGFVLVATSVIWRRTYGFSQTRMLQRLERQRADLRAQHAQLLREIRDAASRDKLTPMAEQRLRLRMPSDSQVIVIERKDIPPAARDASR
jgi:cell division protein FtsL